MELDRGTRPARRAVRIQGVPVQRLAVSWRQRRNRGGGGRGGSRRGDGVCLLLSRVSRLRRGEPHSLRREGSPALRSRRASRSVAAVGRFPMSVRGPLPIIGWPLPIACTRRILTTFLFLPMATASGPAARAELSTLTIAPCEEGALGAGCASSKSSNGLERADHRV